MKITMLAVSLALVLPSVASADDPKSKPDTTMKDTPDDKMKDKSAAKLTDAEIAILAHIHHVNAMEIDAAKMVQRRGSAKPLKDYAKTMVSDHEQADRKIIVIAKQRGVAKLPADKPQSDEDIKAHKDAMEAMANLKKLKGPELDRAYLQMMITGHEREIARLDTSSVKITDPAVMDLANELKPVLQAHVDRARELQASMETTSRVDQPQKQP